MVAIMISIVLITSLSVIPFFDIMQFSKLAKLAKEYNFPEEIDSYEINMIDGYKLNQHNSSIKFIFFESIERVIYGALLLEDNSRINFAFQNRIYNCVIKKPFLYEPYPYTVFLYQNEVIKLKGYFYYGVFDLLYHYAGPIKNMTDFRKFVKDVYGVYP